MSFFTLAGDFHQVRPVFHFHPWETLKWTTWILAPGHLPTYPLATRFVPKMRGRELLRLAYRPAEFTLGDHFQQLVGVGF